MARLSEKTKTKNPLKKADDKTKDFSQMQGSFGTPQMPQDKEARDTINRTAKKDTEKITKEEALPQSDFFDTHEISEKDLGYTPSELYRKKMGKEVELKEEDLELFDQMLFEGFARQSFEVRGIEFSVRSYSYNVLHQSVEVLENYSFNSATAPQNKGVTMAMKNAIQVARGLYTYKGSFVCDPDAFETKEALEKRLEFVLGLPAIMSDIIGRRFAEFSRRLTLVSEHGLTNF